MAREATDDVGLKFRVFGRSQLANQRAMIEQYIFPILNCGASALSPCDEDEKIDNYVGKDDKSNYADPARKDRCDLCKGGLRSQVVACVKDKRNKHQKNAQMK